jgi:CheY-like chemotaxis protein
MDISLPVLDGLAAARQLKSDSACADIPVIFVSGDAFAAHRAHAAGGAMFLAKPVRLTELLSAVVHTLPQNIDERHGPRVTRPRACATTNKPR